MAVFPHKGLELIKEAKAADEKEDFPEALRLYKQGLKYLMMGEKYTKNDRAKAAINEKVLRHELSQPNHFFVWHSTA